MVFAHPSFLWLLPLAPAVAYAGWRAGGPRRLAVAAIRTACLGALTLALARPMVGWQAQQTTSVNVIDLGPAVADARIDAAVKALPPAGENSRVVAFANRAEVVADRNELLDPARRTGLRKRLNAKLWPDDAVDGGSNLAAALQLAAAQVPPQGRGDVRVLATGLNNHDDAEAEAWRLAGRGIPIRTEATDVAAALPAVRAKRVSIAGQARAGQTLRADVEIESTVTGQATVRLTPGAGGPVTASVAVTPGVNRVSVSVPLATPGVVPVRVAAWAGEAAAADDAVLAAVRVRAPADVLLVQDDADAGLAEALAALLGNGVRITPVTPEALAGHSPATADAVVLADVPADRLPAAAQTALRDAVRGGTGLLLTGAARSFGPGGYDDSQLAQLLPVKMPQQAENIDPSTTLVLIIDTSGSMSGDRIDLAKEVARLALSHLKPHDKVGIVEFYGGKRWAAPIQSAGNTSIIGRALDRLTAGGGTTLYPAVEEAAFALRNVRTRSKNLLVLSDGGVEDAPFGSLVRQMAEDGITVSTGQVGPPDNFGPGGNQMADVARWGNGRFYTVPDAFALPDIQFKQPQISLISPVVQTPTSVIAGDDALLRGAGEAAFAPVSGYVRTEAKPTADVLLKTASGDPLMVRWRYGAGYVAALPTQLGSSMTAQLHDTAAFGRLMSGLVRQLDDVRGEPLAVTATVRPAGVEVDVAAASPVAAVDATVEVRLTDAAGNVLRQVTAEPAAPGRWNVLLPGVTAGTYGVTADAHGATGEAAVAIAPPRAVAAFEADRALLSRLGGFASYAAERAAALPPERVVWVELWQALVVLAVTLLVLQVAVRRWPLPDVR